MLRIGDFSRICQVTIKTLRHYDRLGLLEPAQVDRLTGHRIGTLGAGLSFSRPMLRIRYDSDTIVRAPSPGDACGGQVLLSDRPSAVCRVSRYSTLNRPQRQQSDGK